jgi:hypothetical protein
MRHLLQFKIAKLHDAEVRSYFELGLSFVKVSSEIYTLPSYSEVYNLRT